jgi:glutathione peroxidase
MTVSLYDIPLRQIDGSSASLADYRGNVLLVVNVASKCGLTPQYTELERLYQAKHANGLEVLGFPANNFKGQEPGGDSEIAKFCSAKYGVHFPLFSKISVLGEGQHPLYARLTAAQPAAIGDGRVPRTPQELRREF